MNIKELQLRTLDGEFHSLDLNEDTQFALNYSQSELENPTVTKNTYSANISIPRTKHNNDIFGQIWRVDSIIHKFNPNIKADFRLFVNASIFEDGFIELLEITEDDYQIRLYGSIGNFFYDLDQILLSNLPVDENNYEHTINVKTLHDLHRESNPSEYYGYALTFQGEYDNFDNSQLEEEDQIIDAYWYNSGQKYGDVELNEHKRRDRNISGEYRTYYQKPTLRVQPIIETIIQKAEELGYEVELDDKFFNEDNPYWSKSWIICPNYPVSNIPGSNGFDVAAFGKLTVPDRASSSLSIGVEGKDDDPNIGVKNAAGLDINESYFQKDSINQTVRLTQEPIEVANGETINLRLQMKQIAVFTEDKGAQERYRSKTSSLSCRLTLYDDTGSLVYKEMTDTPAASNKAVGSRIHNSTNVSAKRPTNETDGFGKMNFSYDAQNNAAGDESTADVGTLWSYAITYTNASGSEQSLYPVFEVEGTASWKPNGNHSSRKYGVAFQIESGAIVREGSPHEDEDINEGFKTIRSGSQITFADMIGDKYTAHQFLLSFCKVFGLFIYVDRIERTVKITLRDNFYSDNGRYEILDWTGRIDRSKDYNISPTSLEFQKGVFKWNALDTKYEELYRANTSKTINGVEDIAGREYGSANVITGYNLNDNEYDYLEGIIFDNCVVAYDYSPYYRGNGASIAFRSNKELPHMQDSDGSKVEQEGFILVFREDNRTTPDGGVKFAFTDDTPLMTSYGTICWKYTTSNETYTPFRRYLRTIEIDGEHYSWNFQMPNQSYGDTDNVPKSNIGIFNRYWRGYIYDRLDENSKTLTCYVALRPSDLQYNLLSKFIHIDNTLWVIDSISDFNPLSPEPTKITFVKVQNINSYLDHSFLADNFLIEYNGEVIYDNTSGNNPGIIYLDDSTTDFTLDVTSNVSWFTSGGLVITPDNSLPSDTPVSINVNMPVSQNNGSIIFDYNGQTVTIRIFRRTLVNVIASTSGGTTATINGLPSPQQIHVGNTARFSATGDTPFLRWEINGVEYTQQTVTITITEDITATAYFLYAGQVILYSNDQYTTITGVEKQSNYWVLNVGQSYTFNNSQPNFSGFLFSGDTEYTPAGSKTIEDNHTSLSVFYDQILLNLEVFNQSTVNVFNGDNISIGDSSVGFDVDPGETIETIANTNYSEDAVTGFTFGKLPYHYPTFSQETFTSRGIYDVIITGNRVGWEGDVTEDITQSGYVSLNRIAYGPVAFNLISNVSITPNQGSADTNVSIELTGNGGTVTQRFAPNNLHSDTIEYELILNQNNAAGSLGYTSARLVAYQSNATQTDTSATVIFYHNNSPLILSDGLTKGMDTTDANGAVYSTMTATFTQNQSSPRQLTFTIQASGQAYVWTINQDGTSGGGNANQWWGQTPNAAGVVQGTLTNTGHIIPQISNNFDIGSPSLYFDWVYANRYLPSADNTYNIGAPSYRFATAHINGIASGVISSSAASTFRYVTNNTNSCYNLNPRLYVGNVTDTGALNTLLNGGYTLYSTNIGCQTLTETSDLNKKDIICEVKGESIDISGINAYNYTFKEDDSSGGKREYTGLIAQELKPIIPNAVSGEEGNYGVNYSAVTAVLLAKVKELEKRIKELEDKK